MTFSPADILIPKSEDKTAWSVVACDQYTSEGAYWEEVEKITNNKLSTFHLILPEIYLEEDGVDKRIEQINDNMKKYCNDGIFDVYPSSYLYIERTQRNGRVRRGIIGAVDLEDYEYTKGSKSRIRATEGTVTERIPPRLKVRINACLELPHVMLLIDDRKKVVIEQIGSCKDSFKKVYDFDLMMDSGHLAGWLIDENMSKYLQSELEKLSDITIFNEKYGVNEAEPLVFAVGDGNHSLATAKEYYNQMKAKGSENIDLARYALVELVNLHDDSLVFEAIHRVVFDVDVDKFKKELEALCTDGKKDGAQSFTFVSKDGKKDLTFTSPSANLTVGTLQSFIDDYIAKNGGRVDYIHGDDVVETLSSTDSSCGILLDAMDKNELYKTVIVDGALPRKTFSMGDACDKRFYTEARLINKNY